MTCSAFCLAFDAEASDRATKAAGRIDRVAKEVSVTKGAAIDRGNGGRLVALRLEGEGLPAVHGWLGGNSGRGEYSMVAESGGSIEASRDALGTRPLFLAKSGRWVASDHRFFPGEPRELLPPGARLEIGESAAKVEQRIVARSEDTFEEAAGKLARLVDASVKERVEGRRLVAVAFSGGLDSSIVAFCAARHAKVVACSVSAPGSLDRKVAEGVAGSMGLEFLATRLDGTGVAKELRGLDLPFEPTRMDEGLWCIYSMASRLAAEAGAEFIMLGQLADELFGGYAKYERKLLEKGRDAAEKLMADDVAGCGTRGFVRDEAACSRWLEPRFPFSDARVADFGLTLPAELKIRGGVRKAVLREAAMRLGVPGELVNRPKKAAQYSSGIAKILA